jgi:hypothetical protein
MSREIIRCAALVSAFLVPAVWCSRTSAQGIQGFVITAAKEPVAGARLRLLRGSQLIGQTFADSAGGFVIRAQKTGTYQLMTDRIGFDSVANEVKIERGSVIEVVVVLGPRAVELPALIVSGKRKDVREAASYEGMLARKAAQRGPLGSIVVLKRGDPEFDASSDFNQVARWYPPLKCVLAVFWNGIPTLNGSWLSELNLEHIEAVEIFRDQLSAPREFRSFSAAYVPQPERLFPNSGMMSDPGSARLRNQGLPRSAGTVAAGRCGIIAYWSRR